MCLHLSHTKCQDRCLPVIIRKSALQGSDTNTVTMRYSVSNSIQKMPLKCLYYGNLTRPFIIFLFVLIPSTQINCRKTCYWKKNLARKIIATQRFCSILKYYSYLPSGIETVFKGYYFHYTTLLTTWGDISSCNFYRMSNASLFLYFIWSFIDPFFSLEYYGTMACTSISKVFRWFTRNPILDIEKITRFIS